MSGTPDVEGQSGDPALGGGGLAVLPIAAMGGAFWDLTGADRVVDPQGWSSLTVQLSEAQVADMGGEVASIDDDGDFRLKVPSGEYAVCYWSSTVGGRVTGCDAVELPAEGELEASWGEGGFGLGVTG